MTLRRGVITAGLLAMAAGLVWWREGGAAPLIVYGALLASSVIFEKFRYQRETERPPGPGWVQTQERMVEADRLVTVWFNPTSGERRYVRSPPDGTSSV